MVTVAIAGATTGFGLTMLRTFLALNAAASNPQHTLVLLSRNPQPELTAQGVDVRIVDYTSHSSLVAALHGIHTVLSTIGSHGLGTSQLALLRAAQQAGVRRFAPSEYAIPCYDRVDLYAEKKTVWEAVRASGLEYTRFSCGLFISLLATGTPKPVTEQGLRDGAQTGEEEALAGLRPWNFVLNLRAGTADFAGDGTTPVVWTEMHDVARFVWEALGSTRPWPEESGMRGDVRSFREVMRTLEKVQQRKFLVRETKLEELLNVAETNPGMRFYNQTRVALQDGEGLVGDKLNQQFPQIKPTTCEEFIWKWWGGVSLGEPAWAEDRAFGAEDM